MEIETIITRAEYRFLVFNAINLSQHIEDRNSLFNLF